MHKSPGWQYSLGEMLWTVAVVALWLTAYLTALRGLSEVGLKAVLVKSTFACALMSGLFFYWLVRWQAGACRERLRAEPLTARRLVTTSLSPALFILLMLIVPTGPAFDSVRVGVVGGLSFVAVFDIFAAVWNSVELCDNGIVTNGLKFSAWSKIKLRHIRIDTNGNILIGGDLLGITAIVRPEQRDSVESILKEKLGFVC